MNKYFVMSDIHSFFDEMLAALTSAGFDIDNPEHILIICGDVFDRGPDSISVFNYIKSIPKDRKILIKGNHESLFIDLIENKNYPDSYDFSNGTVRTCCHIAGIDESILDYRNVVEEYVKNKNYKPSYQEIKLRTEAIWSNIRESVKNSEIYNWINSDEWVDYYELDNYIFVHSFIPLQIKENLDLNIYRYFPTYEMSPEFLQPVPDWRTKATDVEWEDARWGCPWRQFKSGLFDSEAKNKKKLVCGHWHASDFHKVFEPYDSNSKNNFNIYYGKHLIALDACTVISHFCNVLIIDTETNKCYNSKQKLLRVKRNK